jgi:hypothetical protein
LAAFIYRRAHDQLAMSVAYPNLSVRMFDFLPGSIDTARNRQYRSLNSYVSYPHLVWTENDKAISDVSKT